MPHGSITLADGPVGDYLAGLNGVCVLSAFVLFVYFVVAGSNGAVQDRPGSRYRASIAGLKVVAPA